MKHPKLIAQEKKSAQEVLLTLYVPKELIFFDGHFPDIPILPGIVQVDWAIYFSHQFFSIKRETILSIPQLKFTHIISPDNTLSLSLLLTDHLLSFQYFDADKTYSSGKLKVAH